MLTIIGIESHLSFAVTLGITNLKHLVYFRTVDLCRQAEAAGISYLTVHGRRKDQKGEPVNLDAIKAIKDSIQNRTGPHQTSSG